MCDGSDIFLVLIAILFPPLTVWVKRGLCSADSVINIALCMLGYLPGLLHAWYIISKYPDAGYERVHNEEGGSVRVMYVSGGPPPPSAGPTAGAHSTTQAGYGTIAGAPKTQSSRTQGGSSSQRPVTQQPPKRSEQAMPKFEEGNGAGPSDGLAPPSYADAVQGDNKIQSHA